ncbi:hypothetical protein BKA70DRAFT_266810 [Coprinopsis sp. MPI-PUGE-AT-0042]|nr:hypothetical protein BKA70DRAFT_266810 [Coprinopsis sp. MPI-PUGE-AT-0042]
MLRLLILYSSLLVYLDVCAQTSLYIPGFDPQPVSAKVAGVDSDGRTTWLLNKGSPTAGFTPTIDFVGTATLVQGSDGALLAYSNPAGDFAIAQQCTFSEQTLAVCTIVAQGATVTQTEVISRIPIQGGETLAVTSSQSQSSRSSDATTAPPPSSTSSLPSDRPNASTGPSSTTVGEPAEPSDDSQGHSTRFQPWVLGLVATLLSYLLH